MTGRLHVSTCNQIDPALASEWYELYRRTPDTIPWQSPVFCQAAITMNGDSIRPLVLTCRDDAGRPVGVLPLGNERRQHGPFSIKTIRAMSPRRLDFSDPLVASNSQQILVGIANGLEALRRGGFEFDLRHIVQDGPLAKALGPHFHAVGKQAVRHADLAGKSTWRDVITSGHQRREIDRSWRRLGEHPEAAIRWATHSDEAVAFARAFADLHAAQQTGRGRASAFSTPSAVTGLSDLLLAWVPKGEADIGLLQIGNDVAAAYILFHRDATTWAWRTCFSPTHARLGPGALALSAAVDRSIVRGSSRYEFGFGDEPYKHHWSEIGAATVRIKAAPPPYRALPYRLLNRILRGSETSD